MLELHFKNLSHEIQGLRNAIEGQELQTARRFLSLDVEIDKLRIEISELKQEGARYKTVLAFGATLGATIFAFLLNKLF